MADLNQGCGGLVGLVLGLVLLGLFSGVRRATKQPKPQDSTGSEADTQASDT